MPRRWKSSDLIRSPRGTLIARDARSSVPAPLTRQVFIGTVIGIDPSLRGTGIAVIRSSGKTFQLLHSCTLRPKSPATLALGEIAAAVHALVAQHRPTAAAVEEAIFAQNHRTALTLGAARGAILATLALGSIPAHGFAPTRIKQSIVGHGRASKAQIMAMTQRLLSLPAALPHDEADAAAAALCFILTHRA